jgi:hypothetical protein
MMRLAILALLLALAGCGFLARYPLKSPTGQPWPIACDAGCIPISQGASK